MASTVVASRNESSWGKSLDSFMGKKLTYPNSHQNPNNNNKNNPNSLAVNSKQSKSKPKKKKCLNDTSAVIVNQSSAAAAASDDAYSFNQRTNDTKSICFDQFNQCRYIQISVSASSRSELVELKKKLETELDRVRNVSNRIESGHFGNFPARSKDKDKEKCNTEKKVSGYKRQLPVGSVGPGGPVRQGLVGVYSGNGGGSEELMKMCKQILMKMMKHKHSWVFNKPVDAVALGLHDYHQIVKRPMDLGTVKMNLGKGVYGLPTDFAADVRLTFNNALLYNPKTDEVHLMAAQMLAQFEDLFRPVQEKMGRSFGREEVEEEEENVGVGIGGGGDDDEVQGSSWNEVVAGSGAPAVVVERPKKPTTNLNGSFGKERELKKPKTSDVMGSFSKEEKEVERVVEVSQPVQQSKFQPSASATNVVNSDFVSPAPAVVSPVRAPPAAERPRPVKDAAVKMLKQPKQPKPRAKDPNKREMSMEEKQKLGNGLQNLPQEKMPQLVHIIRKRNLQLSAESDEIELDIEALDTETLWELDRFVTNWKKLESKTKREALMGINSAAPSSTRPTTDTSDTDEAVVVSKKNEVEKKMKNREDDIDIGDEMPESSFPPVEIEKDDGVHVRDTRNKNGNGNASSSGSSSGSSSSDSSSSSGSDSGSSSGSDSDADEAHS